MLLFILCCFCARIFVHCISKHLMLLFIILDSWARSFRFSISKHLMLLFIRSHLHHLPVCLNYFKTSYVIVYHVNQLIKQMNKEFQNILCYCLSLAFPRFLVSPLPFFPLYFLYFSIFYQPTPLSWTALLIIP